LGDRGSPKSIGVFFYFLMNWSLGLIPYKLLQHAGAAPEKRFRSAALKRAHHSSPPEKRQNPDANPPPGIQDIKGNDRRCSGVERRFLDKIPRWLRAGITRPTTVARTCAKGYLFLPKSFGGTTVSTFFTLMHRKKLLGRRAKCSRSAFTLLNLTRGFAHSWFSSWRGFCGGQNLGTRTINPLRS